jgi:hypothetical protein
MSLAEEYREFAQECLHWAVNTHTDEHRRMLLEMAKTWTLAALGGAVIRAADPAPVEPHLQFGRKRRKHPRGI